MNGLRHQPRNNRQKELLQEQENRCFWCCQEFGTIVERKGKYKTLMPVWDHLIPIATGGSSKDNNFVAACQICNGIKGAMTPAIIGDVGLRDMIVDKWESKGYRIAGLRNALPPTIVFRPVTVLKDAEDLRGDSQYEKASAGDGEVDKRGISDIQSTRHYAWQNIGRVSKDGGKSRSQTASTKSRSNSVHDRAGPDDITRLSIDSEDNRLISATVSLPNNVYQFLKQRAARRGMTFSGLIRMYILRFCRSEIAKYKGGN